MNVLFLNWKDVKNPEVGGAEIIAFEFARRLVREGHVVTFFARHFKDADPIEKIDGVKIIRKGNKFTSYFHAYFYYKSLRKKPDKVLDMINTICWQTPFYVRNTRRVAYINQLAKEVLFYELPWVLSSIAYLLERFEYIPYRNTKVLCYSQSTKNDLISFGIKRENIFIFPLGLDHKRYIVGGNKSNFPHFLFVARLVKMKRADLCVSAMRHVIKEYPNAILSLVGTGPDEGRLKRLVNKHKLVNNVEFIDKNNFYMNKTKGDIKVKLMQEAWALILPSVKEGWGMVVTEAAACGTPAIVSRVTGLVDSVKPNKTGIILSPKPNEKELAKAMITIIEDNNLRKHLSSGAVEWSKEFDWDKSYVVFRKLLLK
jgi:glycosyltransferase involved in cell wall biosynthesis